MYLWDIPKEAVLKRSAKGAMSSSFRRAPKNLAEMQYLSKFFQALEKSLKKTFPK